ncbi:MAG: DUF547 domain-containing protein [Candidatus Rokuibacteriota bacterium]
MPGRVWGIAVLVAGVTLGSLGLASGELFGPPKSNLWPRWERHNPDDTRTIDHTAWDAFLAKYVDGKHPSGINRVNYKAVSPEDRKSLEDYLTRLQAVLIAGYNRNEQRAYWINLYNAQTVKIILDYYPVTSIRKIKIPPGLFTIGPWDGKVVTVEGERLSLNDIEHRILRPIWKDPKIHYAINCASLGCPNLSPVAFTAPNTESRLTQYASDYINHPRGASFKRNRLKVSSIYVWFQEDFGGNHAGVVQHLKQFATGDLAKQLQAHDGGLDDDYDWNLNQP